MDDLLPEELKEDRFYRLAPNAMERDLGLFTQGSRSQITCDEVRRYTGMSLPVLRARFLLAGGKLRYHHPSVGDYGWFKVESVPSVAWWSEQYAIAEYLCLKDRGIVD